MDKSVAAAKLADKAVTREKLDDDLFPLFDTAEVSAQYTIAANSVASVLVGNIPTKPGYTYVGMCDFNSGHISCGVSSVSGRYMSVINESKSNITATAKIKYFYVRS